MNPTHFVLVELEKIKHELGDGSPSMGINAINMYQCGKCKEFHHSQGNAHLCCHPNCLNCGKELSHKRVGLFVGTKVCDACREEEARKNVIEKLRNAERVDKPTTSFLFVPGIEDYLNLDDYEDYEASGLSLVDVVTNFCQDRANPVPAPEYVFDCDAETWEGLNLHTIIESDLEEWFEDAADHLTGVDELAKAIAAFNAKQTLTQYHQSPRIIILDPARFDASYMQVTE
ncbi:hypothetical protein QMM96_22165 [Citrobacter freundii]|uniref:hypothetical protein n=1 Tax=Citrobacter freundii TaxID=546 RepID=UPI002B2424CD|nr:hypothetical protein [Citrobacter freundii]MEB2478137.1 hypothetical protein [Citrobacter freundii]